MELTLDEIATRLIKDNVEFSIHGGGQYSQGSISVRMEKSRDGIDVKIRSSSASGSLSEALRAANDEFYKKIDTGFTNFLAPQIEHENMEDGE